jgi:hypothetical protein
MPIWIIWKNIEDYLCPESIIVAEGGVGQTLSDGPCLSSVVDYEENLFERFDRNAPEKSRKITLSINTESYLVGYRRQRWLLGNDSEPNK